MNALLHIWLVFSKEVRDNLRDRRSLISALSSSLIGPGILLLMIFILGKTFGQDYQDQPLDLPAIGLEHAPALAQFLEQNNVVIQKAPEDPEAAVRNGDLDVVLVIEDGKYAEDFGAGRPASVRLVLDSSRQSAMPAVERTRGLLNAYAQQIAALRLMARGVSPTVIRPLTIEENDLATPETQSLLFLNMMPYFVVLVVFIGGMYVVIDATAGERERGSLEPLLIVPVQRWELVLGKLSAALPFAAFAVLLTLGAFWLGFNLVPLEDIIGIKLALSAPALAGIFLIALPMILLASGLQMIVATFTRSFKEAQTYVSLMALLPALPGLGVAFLPIKAGLVYMLIPTFGQQLLINQLMRSEPLNPLYVTISTLSTLIVSGALIYIAVRLYEREQIIFGPR
jgi:sodium transport system permease protein